VISPIIFVVAGKQGKNAPPTFWALEQLPQKFLSENFRPEKLNLKLNAHFGENLLTELLKFLAHNNIFTVRNLQHL